MRFLKRSLRPQAKISLILADWGVRESFHILSYLGKQSLPRDLFEVIIVEYYSKVSPAVQIFEEQVDIWVLLDIPSGCYYHKHLLYNAGILLSSGEICVICDSDAMVKGTFLQSILDVFTDEAKIVLHMDEFRNVRRDMYPFNYPSFEEVLGNGCINQINGMTTGLVDTEDTLHTRNYGACMCAKRDDLIAIGGADEHIDYLGHVCGPYDMTFRLANLGCLEVWHQTEFLYHTWHPGSDGTDNYLGPHDGQNVSTTALEAITSGRIYPYVENPAIQHLRVKTPVREEVLPGLLINRTRVESWARNNLWPVRSGKTEVGWVRQSPSYGRGAITVESPSHENHQPSEGEREIQHESSDLRFVKRHKGFQIFQDSAGYSARLLVFQNPVFLSVPISSLELNGKNISEVEARIESVIPHFIKFINGGFTIVGGLWGLFHKCQSKVLKRFRRLRKTIPAGNGDGRVERAGAVARFSCVERMKMVKSWLMGVYTKSLLSLNPGLLQVRDLVINLYLLRKATLLSGPLTQVTVVTSHSLARHYLVVFSLIGFLPNVEVRRVLHSPHLQKILTEQEKIRDDSTIFITQSDFIRFREVIVTSPNRSQMVCI
jgi:hypothetical protein